MGGSCPRSVCLRSSVMYGRLPRNKAAVRGMRFLQFCDEALERSAAAAAAGEEEVTSASFFDDEFRPFVAVTDVAKAVVACVRRWGRNGDEAPPCAINVGGPERLSRAQFARLVAGARGLDPATFVGAGQHGGGRDCGNSAAVCKETDTRRTYWPTGNCRLVGLHRRQRRHRDC